MRRHAFNLVLTLTILMLSAAETPIFAQEPSPASAAEAEAPSSSATAPAATNVPKLVVPNSQIPNSQMPNSQIIVPAGTRMPLVLRNGVNTRTATQGDSVYFETVYPIAANNRIAIPMGTFVRGEILEAKRPGRIHGRGELRMALEQMIYPNGYTIELRASPSSVDPNTGSGVNAQKTIEGPSSSLRDTTAVLLTTAGGAYIGAVTGGVSNGAPGRGALAGGAGPTGEAGGHNSIRFGGANLVGQEDFDDVASAGAFDEAQSALVDEGAHGRASGSGGEANAAGELQNGKAELEFSFQPTMAHEMRIDDALGEIEAEPRHEYIFQLFPDEYGVEFFVFHGYVPDVAQARFRAFASQCFPLELGLPEFVRSCTPANGRARCNCLYWRKGMQLKV